MFTQCPSCASPQITKDGRVGKRQRYKCKSCGLRFVEPAPPKHNDGLAPQQRYYRANRDRYSEQQRDRRDALRKQQAQPMLIREVVSNGLVCPSCLSPNFVGNGTRNGRKRYLCRNCGRSFGEKKNDQGDG
ncbi:MAG: IS1/IS1595 family N-terminal zinc-binding domain-containing protein [Microcoleus sp.]